MTPPPGAVLGAVVVGCLVALLLPVRQRHVPASAESRSGGFLTSISLWALVAPGLVLAGLSLRHLALVLVLLAAGVGALRLVQAARRERAAVRRGERTLGFCEAMAAELVAGRPPPLALRDAAQQFPEFAAVARAAELGADVPAAMREQARESGVGDLRLAAAAWEVSQSCGGGLAEALLAVAKRLRNRRGTRRLVAGELAGARAATRLIAGLPVVVALAGTGLGADPLGFLTGAHGPLGLGCLAGGLSLTLLGMAWMQHIAHSVEAG